MAGSYFLTFLLPILLPTLIQAQASGSGSTTRYWDCCKPSCSWPGKATVAPGSHAVNSCDISNNPLADFNAPSYCATSSGTSYMCGSQTPWSVSDTLSYGFAATNIAGGNEASWCCACYELTFTSGPVSGKKMIVQSTNTGGDLGNNQFDLAIPGGGFGIFDACTHQYSSIPSSAWGERYGGVSSRDQCAGLPKNLQDGCYWRFDWFKNANNPGVSFKQVSCPAALTAKSGCVRSDNGAISGSSATTGKSNPPAKVVKINTPAKAAVKINTPAKAAVKINPATNAGKSGQSGSVAKYAQCGGQGWKGATHCASTLKCTKLNDYYYQCL